MKTNDYILIGIRIIYKQRKILMNIEKIYSALKEDQMNSALGIITLELEAQGYEIKIEGIKITSEEVFENKFPSLEEIAEPLNIILFKDGKVEQKFSIDFIEYHKIIFKEFNDGK